MAQRGSGRSGSKARPAGRGAGGRNSSSGRGSASGGRTSKQQTSMAAQRAIKGARGRSGNLLRVGVPVLVVVLVAAAVIFGVIQTGKHNTAASGGLSADSDHNPAILASTVHQGTGNTVDGVQSNSSEQLIYHIHAHLAMYVNGTQKFLPYGLGIVPPYQFSPGTSGASSFVSGGSKFYWLHTHDESGVIHIETPAQHTYTLGNFFDLWGQPLSATQLGPNKGKITAFVDGKAYTGDPRNIPLNAHNVIQLDLGTVVPFSNFTFPQGE